MGKATIVDMGNSGEGVAPKEGKRLFLEGALPGEVVTYKTTLKKKSYEKGQTLEVLEASPDRVAPPCPYYERCGGCQLQHLEYDKQLKYKQNKVVQALKRIGGIEEPNVSPCRACTPSLHYRNKIQMPIEGDAIGLYQRGTHELIDIEACLIHTEEGEAIYKKVRPLLKNRGYRALLLKSTRAGEVLITLISRKKSEKDLPLAEKLLALDPKIAGVVLALNEKEGNSLVGSKATLLTGKDSLTEELNSLKFKLSSSSFFQVNASQAEALFAEALARVTLKESDRVVDAYCGVGTLALHFANKCKEVLGIECVPSAIENAKENAQLNKINNAQFTVGLAEKELPKLDTIDLLLLNPPRKGVEKAVIEAISKSKPREILYVSCDPATLARDVKLLHAEGYQAGEFTPFDMFPQTSHVETLVLLKQIL